MNEQLCERVKELAEICRDTVQCGASIVITGHDNPDSDSIISAVMLQDLLRRFDIYAEIKFETKPDKVTLRDVKMLGVWQDGFISRFEPNDKLLLVDHHKTFYGNEVIGCVDHHTTPPRADHPFNLVAAASSCGKMIFDMMKACGCADEKNEMLALYSVYLDTQSCKSSKFNISDAPWVEECIVKYALDKQALTIMGYCLNSPDEPIDELSMYAYKRYEFGGRVSGSGCIQIDQDIEKWDDVISGIIDRLKIKVKDEGYELWILVVNKPRIAKSDLYFINGDGGVQLKRLDRLASRSKDVIPIVSSIK